MESVTAAVRGASLPRAPVALVRGGPRAPRRVVGVGAGLLAAPGRRRRALVAVASLQEPLPSRAQEVPVAVAPQADEEEVHGNGGSAAAESSSPPVVPGKTVRVRFVLEKPLGSDQNVCLVGGDPELGLWDPANASPLEWAESHGWILEKGLPANKLIEFKFLLRDSSGKLHWQNGPNRSFQTGEATNALVVYEDWVDVKNQKIAVEELGDVKNQKITEEEGVASVGMEEAVVSDDSESGKSILVEDELQMDDNQEVREDESAAAEEDEKSTVATNASDQVGSLKTNETNPQESMLQKEPETIDNLAEMVGVEEGGALCADENFVGKNEGDNILSEDGVPDENGSEGDNILSEDGVPVENGSNTTNEHDLLWGWKALQQLLMNLGIKMDTT